LSKGLTTPKKKVKNTSPGGNPAIPSVGIVFFWDATLFSERKGLPLNPRPPGCFWFVLDECRLVAEQIFPFFAKKEFNRSQTLYPS
jgi:hypothetical protein